MISAVKQRILPLALMLGSLFWLAACARTPAPAPTPVIQTVVVQQTVVVERTVEVTPTPDPARQIVTAHLNLGGEPAALDPALFSQASDRDVVENLFVGLTRLDGEGQVQPALATEWSNSADGLRWTFTLRQDLPWVRYRASTGAVAFEPVTADDVAYAVRRACDPRTGASAGLDYGIVGCQAADTADPALSAAELDTLLQAVGVVALDRWTVQFTLAAPAADFPAVAGLPLNRPVPRAVIEQFGPRWTEAGNIVTNGPYALAGWVHGDTLTLARNPHWPDWAAAAGNIERIEWAMLDETAAQEAFAAGRLDSIVVPSADQARVTTDSALAGQRTAAILPCTAYLGLTASKPPLDNALVRRALSAALDRPALVQQSGAGLAEPAHTFTPAPVFGSAAGDATLASWAVPPALGGWEADRALTQARAWLAEAGYAEGAGFPPLTLLYNASDESAATAQAVAGMWQSGLGITVTLQSLAWPEFTALLEGDTPPEQLPHVWRMAYCGDYPDQAAWLGQFNTDQALDRLRWASVASAASATDARSFNQLLAAAQRSNDSAERRALYQQAERILNDEAAALIPLFHYTAWYLTRPGLERTYWTATGNRLENWRSGAP